MSNNRGIFESLPASEQNGGVNPFSFAGEGVAATNPLAATAEAHSSFGSGDESYVPEPGKPAKIPAPRLRATENPFQMTAETVPAYGYEAPDASHTQASPFSAVPLRPEKTTLAVPQLKHRPFSAHPTEVAAKTNPAQARGVWPQAREASAVEPFAPQLTHLQVQPSAAQSTAPQQAVPDRSFAAAVNSAEALQPNETSPVYKQLELRAIFGVDREMSVEEILQRTRSLPGIKLVARIGTADVMAWETFKHTLANLGFGGGSIRIFSGTVPIEFIRDGNTVLAVRADGGFAPGVREAIMIVARELEKMS